MAKILLILTGGTICCQKNDGVLSSCTQAAELALVDGFRCSDSPWREAEIVSRFPLDTLSENMTVDKWQIILEELKQTDFAAWDGVVMAHGTDTLGFTAALLAAALEGLSVPLVMVSSQYPLADGRANGHANFRTAVELICERKLPGGVWAVYRNADGRMLLHRGQELRQCPVGSDDFSSEHEWDLAQGPPPLPPVPADPPELPLYRARPLTPCVLRIEPYVGIDYRRFDLEGVRAVVHGVFHCGTACTGRRTAEEAYGPDSLLWLQDRCRERGVPLFIGPVELGPQHDPYATMTDYSRSGVLAVAGVSPETVYARAVLGCALYEDNDRLIAYVTGR